MRKTRPFCAGLDAVAIGCYLDCKEDVEFEHESALNYAAFCQRFSVKEFKLAVGGSVMKNPQRSTSAAEAADVLAALPQA
jgi:hypothetical protein